MFDSKMMYQPIPGFPPQYTRQYPPPLSAGVGNQFPNPYMPYSQWNPYANLGTYQNSQGFPPQGQMPLPYQEPLYLPQYPSYDGGHQEYGQTIFSNPLQPVNHSQAYGQTQQNINPNMHPYPKNALNSKPPSGVQSIMNSFKAQDGSLDLNKMIDTAGQMMNAVTQVSSMVKGFGGMFKV
ncbi:YppG family protein [Cytobacillus sp. Hz8]|uniref:YppG family protein n=1 Tax=Cytobacillus sp. Hz8 TaxID=3347168 RepID=UPI0035DD3C33